MSDINDTWSDKAWWWGNQPPNDATGWGDLVEATEAQVLRGQNELLQQRLDTHNERAIDALMHAHTLLTHGMLMKDDCKKCDAIKEPKKFFETPL